MALLTKFGSIAFLSAIIIGIITFSLYFVTKPTNIKWITKWREYERVYQTTTEPLYEVETYQRKPSKYDYLRDLVDTMIELKENYDEKGLPFEEYADNNAFSEECKKLLMDGTKRFPESSRLVSQMGEDFFALYHLYGRKRYGYFVEFGAHAPRRFSNSFFFEQCLGWKGLCIEAHPGNVKRFEGSNRTCTVVPKCVSDKKGKMGMSGGGETGRVVNKGGPVIECDTLNNILEEHGVKKVDMMFVDVEGYEEKALRGFNFTKYKPDVLFIETDFKQCHLNLLLEDRGYWHIYTQGISEVWIRAFKFITKNVWEENVLWKKTYCMNSHKKKYVPPKD